jgi:hypothetical protein
MVAKIRSPRAQGLTLQAIAAELNRLQVPTTRGGSSWRPRRANPTIQLPGSGAPLTRS